MEKIIKQIIDIEDMAQDVVSEAKKEEECLGDIINRDLEALKKEIDAKVNEKIGHIKAKEEEDSKQRIEKVREEAEKSQKLMDEEYINHKEAWIEQVFSNIVNK